MKEELYLEFFDVNAAFGVDPKGRVEARLEKVLELAERAKVRKLCLCSLKGAFYDYEFGNHETLQTCKGGTHLFPVATLDPRRYPGGKGEVSTLKRQGFRLLRFFPEIQNWPYRLAPFVKTLEELKGDPMVVLLPARGLGSLTEISELIPPDAPYPVVILGVNYWLLSEALAVLSERPNFRLDTSLFDSPDVYELFGREVGHERLLFGSSLPFTGPGAPALALERADIPKEAKEAIAYRNLEVLLDEVESH